jgi:DNA modification methylase
MLMYLIRLSGGDKIGDLCFGSGGTAIACQLLGLDFVGAELCPEAVTIARARLEFWSGLSPQAIDAFKLTGELPTTNQSDKRQISLF